MRVLLTGATGFVGRRIVPELIDAGHQVTGLARSAENERVLSAAGVAVHRGDLEDLASLHDGAAGADGVIHCAFNNDFAHLAAACEMDRRAIEALGSGLAGSSRPFVVTSFSGIGNTASGEPAREDNDPDPEDINPRVITELAAAAVAERGVNVSVMRLPMVHDPLKQGIITAFVALARRKGLSAYVGDGTNCFPSAPVLDVARAYRLALERGEPGSRYHAVAENGVPLRDIAQVIGEGLGIPVESKTGDAVAEHFEFLADFARRDLSASSKQTQDQLGWHPDGPSLLSDMNQRQF